MTVPLDPVGVFRALTHEGTTPGAMFLHAAGKPRARLCLKPAVRLVARNGVVTITAFTHDAQRLLEGRPQVVSVLAAESRGAASDNDRQRLMRPSVLDPVRDLLRVTCCGADSPLLYGAFAYDLLEQFEPLPDADAHDAVADYTLTLPAVDLEMDPATGVCTARSYGYGRVAPSPRADVEALERLSQVVRDLEHLCEHGLTVAEPNPLTNTEATTDVDDAAYAERVVRAKEHILAGDVFQIVPSRCFQMPCPRPAAAFAALAASEPDSYRFFCADDDGCLFGASPECALRVDLEGTRSAPDRHLTITPIAGTRPRGRQANGQPDADLDDRLMADLLADPKERAEHMMLVDLARNDVARVCRPRSRSMVRMLEVEKHARVMHLVSEVRGTLDDSLDALHALRAAMHAGTLIGAPKVRAAQLLRTLEPGRRGFYGGVVGTLDPRGTLDVAIVIRSARIHQGVATVRAGAGVVRDSVPELEAAETRAKAATVLAAIAAAGGAA